MGFFNFVIVSKLESMGLDVYWKIVYILSYCTIKYAYFKVKSF